MWWFGVALIAFGFVLGYIMGVVMIVDVQSVGLPSASGDEDDRSAGTL